MRAPRVYTEESSARVDAPASAVFDYIDDPSRLAAHMGRSSWRMGGGTMRLETDAARGRAPGSHIRLHGRVLGFDLDLDEVVIERDPPRRKVWQTTGEPRLLVIGAYTMGFELTPMREAAYLRVFIRYRLPSGRVTGWLGRILGRRYALWCTRMMVGDTVRHFARAAHAPDLRRTH